MIIGERLRELREAKQLSQGDIEKRTGLLRCYISRVENGHTVPAVETLEKMARALELPLYHLMYDGDKVPEAPIDPSGAPRRRRDSSYCMLSSFLNFSFLVCCAGYMESSWTHFNSFGISTMCRVGSW